MLGLSVWKIVIIAGVIVLLFGRGKVSELMGDVGKGIRSFKKGVADDDEPKVIDQEPTASTKASDENPHG